MTGVLRFQAQNGMNLGIVAACWSWHILLVQEQPGRIARWQQALPSRALAVWSTTT